MTVKHQFADVLHAFAEGKTIQFQEKGSLAWWDFKNPWNFSDEVSLEFLRGSTDYNWRIKPEKQKRWLNIYKDHVPTTHVDKPLADATARSLQQVWGKTRQACLAIEFEEGEGL